MMRPISGIVGGVFAILAGTVAVFIGAFMAEFEHPDYEVFVVVGLAGVVLGVVGIVGGVTALIIRAISGFRSRRRQASNREPIATHDEPAR